MTATCLYAAWWLIGAMASAWAMELLVITATIAAWMAMEIRSVRQKIIDLGIYWAKPATTRHLFSATRIVVLVQILANLRPKFISGIIGIGAMAFAPRLETQAMIPGG